MTSIFTKIINGELPAYKIYEDNWALAFLDINPMQRGQVVLVSKKEVPYIYDLDPEAYTKLMERTQYIAQILKSKFNCNKVCLIVEGYEIAHAHVKLIPTNKPEDLDSKLVHSATKEELEEDYKLIMS